MPQDRIEYNPQKIAKRFRENNYTNRKIISKYDKQKNFEKNKINNQKDITQNLDMLGELGSSEIRGSDPSLGWNGF